MIWKFNPRKLILVHRYMYIKIVNKQDTIDINKRHAIDIIIKANIHD